MPQEAKGFYSASIICLVLIGAAFTVPRLFAGPAGGLEDAAGAALTFIAFGAAGGLLSVSLFVRTIMGSGRLPWPAIAAGLLPAAFAAAGALYVWRAL